MKATDNTGSENVRAGGSSPPEPAADGDQTIVEERPARFARSEVAAVDRSSAELNSDVLTRRTPPAGDAIHSMLRPGVRSGLEQGRPDESFLVPGTRVRHYELIRELGRGGMGRVFFARDLKLGRRVAMKFILAATVDAAERFMTEARATARCHHENIVVIYEVDSFRGVPYMVLEYLEGQTLRSILKKAPLPSARAVELIVPVVRALECAHGHLIIHRDLKPANILVTPAGVVKVLDFGVAKVGSDGGERPLAAPGARAAGLPGAPGASSEESKLTRDGAYVGTPSIMSPEQLGVDVVDHRTDIWAVGMLLYRMLTGSHPVGWESLEASLRASEELDVRLPSVRAAAPHVSPALRHIVDRCLEKRKARRWPSAEALLAELEPLLPARYGRKLNEGESPYPGLSPFEESDANRFFGRVRETLQMVARLRDQPLVAVVGPSGVGKSSFVRAGVVPALKSSGEPWEVMALRPGRQPVASLCAALRSLLDSSTAADNLDRRISAEPGLLGALLREHAQAAGVRILLFVDQFEELYTVARDGRERATFAASLTGMADDAAAPVRVAISLRSDFIDRVAEDRSFADEFLRGILLLSAPDRDGLREALTHPLDLVGYRFEDEAIVDDMLDALGSTPDALPLLQFTAARLWEGRDREAQLLTRRRYDEIGRIAGALAAHADEALAHLAPTLQKLAREIFLRLVTQEKTRAIVDIDELEQLTLDPREVREVIDYLVRARLLVVQAHGEDRGGSVEIVHESLVTNWPTLMRWLEGSQEDAAFLAQLREAARQWERKDRAPGMLWRGDAVDEARRWAKRSAQPVSERQSAFLRAVFALADRSVRIRRALVYGTIAFLVALVAAGGVALTSIRSAERRAGTQAEVAQAEAARARGAEKKVSEQLELLSAKERERQAALSVAEEASVEVASKKEALDVTNARLSVALTRAQEQRNKALRESRKAFEESQKAERESRRARDAAREVQRMLEKERARTQELEVERKKIMTELR